MASTAIECKFVLQITNATQKVTLIVVTFLNSYLIDGRTRLAFGYITFPQSFSARCVLPGFFSTFPVLRIHCIGSDFNFIIVANIWITLKGPLWTIPVCCCVFAVSAWYTNVFGGHNLVRLPKLQDCTLETTYLGNGANSTYECCTRKTLFFLAQNPLHRRVAGLPVLDFRSGLQHYCSDSSCIERSFSISINHGELICGLFTGHAFCEFVLTSSFAANDDLLTPETNSGAEGRIQTILCVH